jgi:lysophospholipase L1-like esterase
MRSVTSTVPSVMALGALFVLLAACDPEPLPPTVPVPPPPARTIVPEPITPAPPGACAPLSIEPPRVPIGGVDPAVPPIAHADTLVPFFERAARLLRGRADRHVRIAVYGDSNLVMDYFTGRMRRVLQLAYGDAGHGFVAVAQPWWPYRHMDVQHGVITGFATYASSTDPVFDRLYGLGGIAAESTSVYARAYVETAVEPAPIGRRVSRFDVFYLRGPRAGTFGIRVDGVHLRDVNAAASAVGLGVEHVDVDDGPHRLELVANDDERRVRFFGVTLERDAPGFVVDSFGVGALNTRAQAGQDPALNAEMLKARDYDLVVFHTGANDAFTLPETEVHLKELVARHRQALPGTPILMMTPPDRGKKKSFEPTLRVVEQRRRFAVAEGTALWDMWEAMGGLGSMARFKARGLATFDYIHFNEAGGAYLADRMVHALWTAMAAWLAENPRAGCD